MSIELRCAICGALADEAWAHRYWTREVWTLRPETYVGIVCERHNEALMYDEETDTYIYAPELDTIFIARGVPYRYG